jgi:multiple sugar transport system permease protein
LAERGYFQKTKLQDAIAGYVFILPNLIGFLVFVLGGLIFSLIISFTDWNLLKDFNTLKFVGFKNYIDLFKDSWFIDSLLNNLWFLCIIPIQVFLAMIVASVLNSRIFARNILRAMYYIPYITSLVAVSVVWMTLLHPRFGPINRFIMLFGVENPPKWLADVFWAKPAVAIIMIWQQLGYHALLYLAALQTIPKDLYEAARIDGANKLQQFFKITIPMISPTTFLIVILSLIASFQSWSMIQILTQGGPGTATHTLGYYIYIVAFKFFRMGYASSIAWVLFVITFIITVVQWRGQKKWVVYM